jgi:ribonuclease P protein component
MWRNALIPVTGPPAERDTEVSGSGRGRKWMNETHLSAERAQAGQDARVPQADVDQGRTGGNPVAPGEGTPATVGVSTLVLSTPRPDASVGALRSRRSFEAVRRGSFRGRSGPLTVSYLEQPTWSRPEVAYAINRRVGTAVVRNRLRRRLRAIVSDWAASLPTGAYVVHTGPQVARLDFDELKVAMSQALERATKRQIDRPHVGGHDSHGQRAVR